MSASPAHEPKRAPKKKKEKLPKRPRNPNVRRGITGRLLLLLPLKGTEKKPPKQNEQKEINIFLLISEKALKRSLSWSYMKAGHHASAVVYQRVGPRTHQSPSPSGHRVASSRRASVKVASSRPLFPAALATELRSPSPGRAARTGDGSPR